MVRDYIFTDDVVAALILSMEKTTTQKIFNIGSGTGHSLNDILTMIEQVLHTKVQRVYQAGRSFDVPDNVLDISNAEQYLGWRPKTSLETGLKKTADYISTNG